MHLLGIVSEPARAFGRCRGSSEPEPPGPLELSAVVVWLGEGAGGCEYDEECEHLGGVHRALCGLVTRARGEDVLLDEEREGVGEWA